MPHTARKDAAPEPASLPASTPVGKVVVLSETGREAMARCRAALDVARQLARDIVLAMSPGAGGDGLEPPEVATVALNCEAIGALHKGAEAWRLARVLESEGADVVHAIGLKPAALAAVALQLATVRSAVIHVPDLAPLEPQFGGLRRPYRELALRLLAAVLRRPGTFLLTESEGDLGELRALGLDPGPRFAVLGGPGVDPDVFPLLPRSPGEMPVAAFVGAVTEASGMRTLMQAFERAWARGLRLQLEIHGAPNGGALAGEWARWSLHPGVRCVSEWPADAREVWRRAEICVWPVEIRQGLPRVVVEAAACGRALIVSDLPGGVRSLVRHEAEGLVVPARDADALGAALERLARDADLRQRLGAAARLRVLQGFTEAHVKEALRGVYLSLAPA